MTIQAKLRKQLFDEIIKNVPFDGWSKEALRNASAALSLEPDYAEHLFADGIIEVVQMLITELDKEMLTRYHAKDRSEFGITKKVKEALKIRFQIMAERKLLFHQTIMYLTLPWNTPKAIKFAWNTADLIWHDVVGDNSLDFNYYSKRSLLSGVYAASLLYFISDNSIKHEDTFDFIDRKINDVVSLGRNLSKLKQTNA
jgi:ubiquinone biosynthesis protein COQ9